MRGGKTQLNSIKSNFVLAKFVLNLRSKEQGEGDPVCYHSLTVSLFRQEEEINGRPRQMIHHYCS